MDWMQYCVEYQAYALLELVSCTQKYIYPFAPTCAAVDVVTCADPVLVAEVSMTVHDAESSHVDSGEWLEQYQMRWLTAQVSVQSHWKVSTVPEFAYVVLPLDGPPDVPDTKLKFSNWMQYF